MYEFQSGLVHIKPTAHGLHNILWAASCCSADSFAYHICFMLKLLTQPTFYDYVLSEC